MHITESFHPPNDVRLSHVQPGQLTFNWSSPDVQCDSVSYKIITSNCGRCPPVTTNTTVTCTSVVASGQVCTFVVQTVVCGNLTGNMSDPIYVILKGRGSHITLRLVHICQLISSVCSSNSSRYLCCSNI